MKILFLNYEYPPLGGGGGVVMAALARELARRHQVTVLTSQAMGLSATSIEQGVRILRAPVFFRRQLAVANFASMLAYLPMATLRGCSLGRRGTFDIVNTHFVVPTGPVGHLLARFYEAPNVLSVHGGDLFDPSKRMSPHLHAWLRLPIRRLLNLADCVVGQSKDTVRHVAEIYRVHRPVRLVPLGITRPPLVSAASREEFRLPSDAFVIVTVGRLVARKRATQLVECLHGLGRADAHLLIVGDGPDTPAIRQLALELGVSERVHLLGQISDAQKYRALAVADVFASTSQHEGFGLVFLEAMAFGLPIICYDRGGQTDFLSTGKTGHVIPLNDLYSFTQALVDMHDDAGSRRDTGRRNLNLVEDFFIDRCADRYEAIFSDVLERRRQPAGER